VLEKGTRGKVFLKYVHLPMSFLVHEWLSSPSVALGEEGLPQVSWTLRHMGSLSSPSGFLPRVQHSGRVSFPSAIYMWHSGKLESTRDSRSAMSYASLGDLSFLYVERCSPIEYILSDIISIPLRMALTRRQLPDGTRTNGARLPSMSNSTSHGCAPALL
jgi:hypothetical protein